MGAALLFEQRPADSRRSRLIQFRGAQLTIHADSHDTHGHFALLELEGGPGGEPPLHVHRYEDEMFYVLDGRLKLFRGPEEITLRTGESAFLPRNLPHTFKIISSYARALVYITPGGFEGYFRELGQQLAVKGELQEATPPTDLAAVSRVAARYGVTLLV
jgi:quercetin dioxygenase-like cupin family protein